MSHSRKTGKDEHIAHLAITVEREFVVHQRLQLGFDQITSLFGRFLRMIVGKGIPGDNAGVVGFRHDHFQRLCVDADARRGKPFLTPQIKVIVGNESFGQLFQRNILPMQFLGKELG